MNAPVPSFRSGPYDIIAINLLPDGKIEWTERIDKLKPSEKKPAPGFRSFFPFYLGEKLCLLINVKSKNTNNVIVELDDYGNKTRKTLFTPEDTPFTMLPGKSLKLSRNEL